MDFLGLYSLICLDDLYKLVHRCPLAPSLSTRLCHSLRSRPEPLRLLPWLHESRNCSPKFHCLDVRGNVLVPVYTDPSVFRSDGHIVQVKPLWQDDLR